MWGFEQGTGDWVRRVRVLVQAQDWFRVQVQAQALVQVRVWFRVQIQVQAEGLGQR